VLLLSASHAKTAGPMGPALLVCLLVKLVTWW
jgi:hypothetical protein